MKRRARKCLSAAASYWWCDGERSLNDIKELVELEAGVPVRNFDLIKYYRFLEKYGMVEFVEMQKSNSVLEK